jgi:hypothetical protein
MRYALRLDENQGFIIEAFEKLGCQVWVIGQPTDLIVLIGGRNVFVEIKDGSKPPSERKHTRQQERFFATWRGDKATVSNLDEVLALVSQYNHQA